MRHPLIAATFALATMAAPVSAQTDAQDHDVRVLLVGNSLTYTNNFPALLRAVGQSQGRTITTETFAEPGATLAERARDGQVSRALRERKFDAIVLQEQGGKLAACLASAQEQRKAPCAASKRAYGEFAALAKEGGTKPFFFATWGPDERWQAKLDRSVRMLAKEEGAEVFNAAGALSPLKQAQPTTNLYPDGLHPSTLASVMLALTLFRDITGTTPVAKDLQINAPLLPVNAAVDPGSPMESQPGLAGDGKVTVIPAALVAPLINALPDKDAEADKPRGRGRR